MKHLDSLTRDALRELLLAELDKESMDLELVRAILDRLDEEPPQSSALSWESFRQNWAQTEALYPEIEEELGMNAPTPRRKHTHILRYAVILAAVLLLFLGGAVAANANSFGIRDLAQWNQETIIISRPGSAHIPTDPVHYQEFDELLTEKGFVNAALPLTWPKGYTFSRIVEEDELGFCCLILSPDPPDDPGREPVVMRVGPPSPLDLGEPVETYSPNSFRAYQIFEDEGSFSCYWADDTMALYYSGLPSREDMIRMIDSVR